LMLLMLAATPWRAQSWRYAYPLLPLLTIGFLVTCDAWFKRVPKGVQWVVCSGPLALQLVFLLAGLKWYSQSVTWDTQAANSHFRALFYDDKWKSLDWTVECMRREGIAPHRLVASHPAWIYLRTGLTTIMPPFLANTEEAQELLQSAKVDYVLIDKVDGGAFTFRYLGEALRPREWEQLCRAPSGDAFLYRRRSSR
jgi:hypothetical protein